MWAAFLNPSFNDFPLFFFQTSLLGLTATDRFQYISGIHQGFSEERAS